MGNPDGRTWLTKTKEQKEKDIQKHFFKSPIPELERRIKQLENCIKISRSKIEKYNTLIRPLLIQEQTLCTKNKITKIKEEIKQLQIEIKKIKAKRRRRKDRKKIKKRKQWLEYQKSLLTFEEIIDIIKRGV